MKNGPSYLGLRKGLDQDQESLLNAVALWIAGVDFGLLRIVQYDSSGNEVVSSNTSITTASINSKAGSASTQQFLASNTSRKGLIIENNSSEDLYVAYAATASTSAFTKRIKPYEVWEPSKNYTGVISGIWTNGVGAAVITELS